MAGREASILSTNLKLLQVATAVSERLLAHEPVDCRAVTLPGGEPQLIYRERAIYAGGAPLALAANQAQEMVAGKNPGVIVFFGFGLGLHVQALRGCTRAPIVVFEPSADLAVTGLSRAPLEVPDVYLVTDDEAFGDILGSLLSEGQAEVVAGALPACQELFPESFAAFVEVAGQCLDTVASDRLTRDRFAVTWVENLAANLPFIARRQPIQVLGSRFAGRPALLVGAGPSLDRNLSDLARLQGRALLVAVHTAVRPLAAAGITPDLVAIIEGQKLDHYFDGTDLGRIVLLPGPQTHPDHLKLGFGGFLGLSVAGHASADWLERAYAEKPLPSSGSVACTAFAALHELECDPLVLVGMDTAYTDGRGHARASETGCCEIRLDDEQGTVTTHCQAGLHGQHVYTTQKVTGWGGRDQVTTRGVLTAFRHWFEAAGRSWASDHCLINATEGGARIRGFREMTLAAVRADFCSEELPATGTIVAEVAAAGFRESRPLIEAVAAEMADIRRAGEAAGMAVDLAVKAGDRIKRGWRASALLDALSLEEQRLRRFTRQTRLLNTLVGSRAGDLAAGSTAPGDETARLLHGLTLSRQLCELVQSGAQELLARFEPVLAAMTAEAGGK